MRAESPSDHSGHAAFVFIPPPSHVLFGTEVGTGFQPLAFLGAQFPGALPQAGMMTGLWPLERQSACKEQRGLEHSKTQALRSPGSCPIYNPVLRGFWV